MDVQLDLHNVDLRRDYVEGTDSSLVGGIPRGDFYKRGI